MRQQTHVFFRFRPGRRQIGKFVNDTDDIRHQPDAGMIFGNIAGHAFPQPQIAAFHFVGQPRQHFDRLPVVGLHRRQHVLLIVVNAELNPFRIYQHKPHFLRLFGFDQRQNKGIQADGLARTGGSGYQQMGHFGQIGRYRFAAYVNSQTKRQRSFKFLARAAVGQTCKINGFRSFRRNFEPYGVAAGYRLHVNGRNFQLTCNIVKRGRKFFNLGAGRRLKFRQLQQRPAPFADNPAVDAVMAQNPFNVRSFRHIRTHIFASRAAICPASSLIRALWRPARSS